MTDIRVTWPADGSVKSGGLGDLDRARGQSWVWVDVVAPSEATLADLALHFGLHPLAIEDVAHGQSRPKIDLFAEGIFLAWLTPRSSDLENSPAEELDVFLAARHLITLHKVPCPEIDQVVERASEILPKGPDFTLHAIIDRLVDGVLEVCEAIGEELEDVEDVLLKAPRPDDLQRLYSVRRRLVRLHRIVGPELEVVRVLVRERTIVDDEAFRYFQDVSDHLARVEDTIDTNREVASAAMDIYLSAVSNRMNEIMKVLTVVATIFMPLTLLSGIYGMNVTVGMWPPTGAVWSFAAVLSGMGLTAVVMAWFFRRRNWW